MIESIKIGNYDDAIKVITPPSFVIPTNQIWRKSIFLGGSIEMDTAEEWQYRFINELTIELGKVPNYKRFDIFNPRRANWDITIRQSITDPAFFQQVNWELDYLETADFRLFYFAPNTLSPISLLEYGKFFTYPNTYLCMHPDYQRAGNLEIFCYRHKIPIYSDFKEIISLLKYS